MSGHSEEVISCRGILYGDVRLIKKPFSADAIGKAIRDALAG